MQKASKSGREKVGLTTVEVFLQMCCLSTSIFERPRLFLCLQHAPITKPIYTQNSEEPPNPRNMYLCCKAHYCRLGLNPAEYCFACSTLLILCEVIKYDHHERAS